MKIIDNIVKADSGKELNTPFGILSEITLGSCFQIKNGKRVDYDITLEDISEVTPVVLLGELYYLSATTYDEIVTELIRTRYSLDKELALVANYRRFGESKEEKEFLDWRSYCKTIAKQIVNE